MATITTTSSTKRGRRILVRISSLLSRASGISSKGSPGSDSPLKPCGSFIRVNQELESILTQGEKEELWASVPEAPGCWTIDLKEIAEVGVKSKSQKKKKRRRKNLTPKKGKMRQYQTLTQAVTDCVSQNYPQVMTTDKISEWLYPRGLSEVESQQVKNAIGKVLSKGSGDLWTRVAVGKYVWKGEREENQSGSTS